MTKKTTEQILERHKALSPALAEAFVSEEKGEMLWLIGEVHHLDEERIKKVAGIVGYIILGFAHPEDLSREITIETKVDKRLANELAHEIRLKIINPIIPELDRLYWHPMGASPITPTSQLVPPQPEILRPAFAPPKQETGNRKQEVEEEQPFVLREESEEPERVKPRDESLVRPSFYEGREAGGRRQETGFERTAARLEIGPSLDLGRAEKKKPEVGKTEEPEIRVVHYSGPQTPVDPFAPQQEIGSRKQETGPTKPPTEVHPENVVDLKDLPK